MGNVCSAKPRAPSSKGSLAQGATAGAPAPPGADAGAARGGAALKHAPSRPRFNVSPEVEEKSAAATKVQSAFRRHQLRPARVSLRVAATQSWRSLPRDRDGKVFPLCSTSLVALANVQGLGNVLALHFELEYGLLFLAIFGLQYSALLHNLDGDVITESALELPFPSAAGSLGNAASLRVEHGAGDALGLVVLTVGTIALRRIYAAWQLRVDDELVTVADYAVQLSGLPRTATSAQVSAWIRKSFFGVQLVGVTLAVDERTQLALMRQLASARARHVDLTRSMLRTRSKRGLARRDALGAKMASVEAQLREARATPRECVGIAFAVFNRMNDSLQVIDETARHPFAPNVRLRARRAPEPSAILWENLHIGAAQRASRQTTGLVLSLAVTAFSTVVMGIARFIQPVYGQGEHRVVVKIMAPVCIVVGNLAINMSVPRIAEHEGWHDATERSSSLCVKLALFQVLNSVAGAVMMFVYEGYHLSAEWYTWAGQMTSAIVLFTILIADGLGLLRLGACIKRVFVAPCARTQANANRAFGSADPLYMSKRLSLVLKYVILAVIMGPFFPTTYALAAIGCLLSYALDKFNMLRQLPALPKMNGQLIVHTILGRVMPVCIALHVPIAILAYHSRAKQLLDAGLVTHDGTCALGVPRALGGEQGAFKVHVLSAVRWLMSEEQHVLAACNHAVLFSAAGGLFVLLLLLCNLSLRSIDRAELAPSLGNYARMEASDREQLFAAQDGLRLYISPTQQQVLMELASKRGEDPLAERNAFTGDSVALSLEAFV